MRAQRATPRIGGKAIERKTGLPQRPKMKPGGDVVRLLGCLTSEEMHSPFVGASPVRPRASGDPGAQRTASRMKDWVPACAGTNGGESRSRYCGFPSA